MKRGKWPTMAEEGEQAGNSFVFAQETNTTDSPEQGYPENRFAGVVDEDLKCAICLSVLREPLQCETNEHHFCSPCIKKHLRNTTKCPTCLEDLSLETLKKPARYLTKHLSFLMMQCDYESRGCPELVKLEHLPRHLRDCGYAPVSCQNDGCCEVVNKQDIFRHENETCIKRRRTDCHNFAETKKEISELKVAFEELLRLEISGLKVSFEEYKEKKDITENLLRNEVTELKVSFEEFKARKEITEDLLREEICDLKAVINELKVQPQLADLHIDIDIEDTPCENVIIIVGGCNSDGLGLGTNRLCSSEMYVWSQRMWLPLPETHQPRSGSSAVVFDDQVFVAGGRIGHNSFTDTIEVLNFGRKPMWWCNFPGKLPFPSSSQSCIVHKDEDCLIVIGGKEGSECDLSDCIYKVSLRPPYSHNFLAALPSPRDCHRAQLVDNRIVIIGGISYTLYGDEIYERDVLSFNIMSKKRQRIWRLPCGIKNMATVTWEDNIVVIGGRDSTDEAVSTVKVFNINTRKSYLLPSMKYERECCTAVVINNLLVVMGGFNNGTFLNVVESFSFATNTWTELPPMNEARSSATSVVVSMPVTNLFS